MITTRQAFCDGVDVGMTVVSRHMSIDRINKFMSDPANQHLTVAGRISLYLMKARADLETYKED